MARPDDKYRPMHITLTANTDWYLFNFRRDLARALREAGYRGEHGVPGWALRGAPAGRGLRSADLPRAGHGFSVAANLRALGDITAAYRELAPDLVHLFTPLCVLLGSIAAQRCGVPTSRRPHRPGACVYLHLVKARLARPVLRRLFRRELQRPGTAVIFQNEADRDELMAAGVVRAEQCTWCGARGWISSGSGPGRSAKDVPAETSSAPPDRVVIVFASRLLREKGIMELVEAFARVRDEVPDAELWIAGKAYPRQPHQPERRRGEALAQKPGVQLLGHVEDMPGLFAQVDIVALPSYREGTPKVLLEAAACGLPIVATDIPGCRGVVEEGDSGYLVPVRDVGALAGALLRLCADAGLRARFGQRGRELMLAGFSMDKVVADTLAVYKSLADFLI